MTGQMRTFLDQTGSLWVKGALVGKVGSVFTSSATQHGGQESTILSFHFTLLHQGMIIVGLPYTCQLQMGSEEHTSELQSLMRISYAVFCLKKKKTKTQHHK